MVSKKLMVKGIEFFLRDGIEESGGVVVGVLHWSGKQGIWW